MITKILCDRFVDDINTLGIDGVWVDDDQHSNNPRSFVADINMTWDQTAPESGGNEAEYIDEMTNLAQIGIDDEIANEQIIALCKNFLQINKLINHLAIGGFFIAITL